MALEIENEMLDGGHFFGFRVAKDQSKNYTLFYQVVGSEYTTVEAELNAVPGTPTAVQASTGWQRILFGTDTKLLEPSQQDIMYHMYIGISPSSKSTRLYQRHDIGKGMRRVWDVVDGLQGTPYGFIRGNESPYDEPGKISELFNVNDVEPRFLMWNNNPVGGDTMDAWLKFYIFKYVVNLVDEKDIVQRMLNKQQRVRYFQFGPPEQPAQAPKWMRNHIETYEQLGVHGGGY